MGKQARITSLGLLSLPAVQTEFRKHRGELEGRIGALDPDTRAKCGAFLRGGTLILAFMEQTRDVIEGRFTVSGGSAIRSDGTYYWRQDAANYVEGYGLALDDEFLRHCEACGWVARELSSAEAAESDDILAKDLRLRVRRPPT